MTVETAPGQIEKLRSERTVLLCQIGWDVPCSAVVLLQPRATVG